MKLRNILAKHFAVLCLALLCFVPFATASAQGVNVRDEFGKTLKSSGLKSGDTQSDVTNALGNVVNTFLGLIGVATFALVVYAGALWILAAGNEDKIEQAKGILKGAVIGLIIIFSSYVIVNFALTSLQNALGNNASAPQEQSGQ